MSVVLIILGLVQLCLSVASCVMSCNVLSLKEQTTQTLLQESANQGNFKCCVNIQEVLMCCYNDTIPATNFI